MEKDEQFKDWSRRGKTFYQEPHSHIFAKERFDDVLNLTKPKSIIDVGCGFGLMFPTYKEHNVSFITGLDFSHGQLEQAQKEAQKRDNINLVQASAYIMPFKDNIFDLAITHTVLQHIHYKFINQAINETKRIVKPNGHIFITEWMQKSRYELTANELEDLASHNIFVHGYYSLFSECTKIKEWNERILFLKTEEKHGGIVWKT